MLHLLIISKMSKRNPFQPIWIHFPHFLAKIMIKLWMKDLVVNKYDFGMKHFKSKVCVMPFADDLLCYSNSFLSPIKNLKGFVFALLKAYRAL